MPLLTPTRRMVLSSGTLAALAAAQARPLAAQASPPNDSTDFKYEVTRTDDEWRAMLSEDEYQILRGGGTEPQRTSDYWENQSEGTYTCKGCDLPIYESLYQVYPGPGWVFFRHSLPDSVLTAIDGNPYTGGQDTRILTIIEVHCRRCGSHLGHILTVGGETVHCINGTSLNFTPAAA